MTNNWDEKYNYKFRHLRGIYVTKNYGISHQSKSSFVLTAKANQILWLGRIKMFHQVLIISTRWLTLNSPNSTMINGNFNLFSLLCVSRDSVFRWIVAQHTTEEWDTTLVQTRPHRVRDPPKLNLELFLRAFSKPDVQMTTHPHLGLVYWVSGATMTCIGTTPAIICKKKYIFYALSWIDTNNGKKLCIKWRRISDGRLWHGLDLEYKKL